MSDYASVAKALRAKLIINWEDGFDVSEAAPDEGVAAIGVFCLAAELETVVLWFGMDGDDPIDGLVEYAQDLAIVLAPVIGRDYAIKIHATLAVARGEWLRRNMDRAHAFEDLLWMRAKELDAIRFITFPDEEVPRRKGGRNADPKIAERDKAVFADRQAGLSVNHIMEKHDISRSLIYTITSKAKRD